MTDADKVLGLLYDRRESSFAIKELAAVAGLSHENLQRAIEQLRQRSHDFDLTPSEGIKLAEPIRLEGWLIERSLGLHRIGSSVICFEAVDSTNDVAMDSALRGDTDGLVVAAEYQRMGRGRQGRQWISAPGENVMFSVVLLDSAGALSHEALTIAAGLSTAEGIDDACNLQCSLKWPNDVLLDGRKVAGVLVERRTSAANPCKIVGIGVNVNSSPDDETIDNKAACLADSSAMTVDRIQVVRKILCRLDKWVRIISEGRVEQLHEAWMSHCDMINQRITVMCAGENFVGRLLDVSPMQGLVLCCDDGRCVHLKAENSTVLVD